MAAELFVYLSFFLDRVIDLNRSVLFCLFVLLELLFQLSNCTSEGLFFFALDQISSLLLVNFRIIGYLSFFLGASIAATVPQLVVWLAAAGKNAH